MIAGFAGGYVIKKQLDNLQEALPQIGRAKRDALTFKLSVRVISASAPALSAPGVWSRQRPRLHITMGDVQKETELADYLVDDNTIGLDKAYECPWRFGETLTFVGRLADLSTGLHMRLCAHNDFQLGPVQFQFARVTDLGETSVGIRQRALPACIGRQQGKDGNWASPVLVIPLSHVHGGKCAAGHAVGEAVAHLTLAFSVDIDPEEILAAADAETLGVAAVKAQEVRKMMDQPWDPFSGLDLSSPDLPTTSREEQMCETPFSTFLASSDLAPDGWTSYEAPNGRKFWHHTALGPAPWEKGDVQPAPRQSSRSGAPTPPSKSKSMVDAPDEDPDAWVSMEGPGGRRFWHNLSLGPPPWERAESPVKESIPRELRESKPQGSFLRTAWAK